MYTILMNKNKQLICTHNLPLYQGENLVDKIEFIYPNYYGDINLKECRVVLSYIDVGNIRHQEDLIPDEDLYKGNKIRAILPITSKISKLAGDTIIRLYFVNDDGDSNTNDPLLISDSNIITFLPTSNIFEDNEYGDGNSSNIANAILYTKQSLTPQQKECARQNIDAASVFEIPTDYARLDHTHSQYLTEHQDLSEYAKQSSVDKLEEEVENHAHSWGDLEDKPYYSNINTILEEYVNLNDSKFTYVSNGAYFKRLKYTAPSTTLRNYLLEKGIDIENMTTDDSRLKIKQIKVTIYSKSSGEPKVVTIDNPTYNIITSGVNSKRIIFADDTGMPIWGYDINADNYEYDVVYTYFGSGSWGKYGVTSSEWGYNPSSKTWLGAVYSFEFVLESIKQIENKYLDIPKTLTGTTEEDRLRVESYNNILYSQYPPVANGSSTYGLVRPVKKN